MVVCILRWHLFFCFLFSFFYFIHQHGINVSSAICIFFFFLHNGLAYKWLFWFVFCLISIRFPVSPVFSPRLTIIITIVIIIVTPNSGARTTRYDSFGILLDCIGEYQIKLVLAQITTFFFPSVFYCGTRVYSLCSLCDSKRL